jgi:hypothetical protein
MIRAFLILIFLIVNISGYNINRRSFPADWFQSVWLDLEKNKKGALNHGCGNSFFVVYTGHLDGMGLLPDYRMAMAGKS